ncbi:hypothetical protein KIH32_14160 [Pseudomonas fluorescens]|uniref:hypothetical protein n=1 Tax=Pseudomonas fluorescens TaxID=294 RepID=UPI001BD9CA5C|nr:hypothetical protein [Pseudomonas fluorescens]MBT0625062.1 hypothetical protein [Pseudomonas fluorescens]
MEDASVLYSYCLLVAAAWGVLVLIGQVYFSYCKIDEILQCLGTSRLVSYRKIFVGADFFSKMLFVNTVAGMFVFQKLHIKDGAVTREELDNVPRRLMLELRLWGFFLMGMGGYAVALWGIGKYVGWLG